MRAVMAMPTVVHRPCLPPCYLGKVHSLKSVRNHTRCNYASRSSVSSSQRTRCTQLAQRPRSCESIASGETVETGKDSSDVILSCVSADAEVCVFVVVATDLVLEAQRRHATAPTATAALGRVLMGTLLLGAMKGWEETVQVSFMGRGDLGQLTAVTSERGTVKGFVGNPSCDPPLNADGKLDVGGAVGAGILTVIRSRPEWQQPYTGTIPLYSGEVAEDLTHYLLDSEQISSSMGLGVAVGREGGVLSAGGFLVQLLPFCSEDTIGKLEANIQSLPPASQLAACLSPEAILAALLKGLGAQTPSEALPLSFGPCCVEDLKPRMMRAVGALGEEDVRKLIGEQGCVEVRCEFCAEVVQFKERELESILVTGA